MILRAREEANLRKVREGMGPHMIKYAVYMYIIFKELIKILYYEG